MREALAGSQAVKLTDGRVLVVGQRRADGETLATTAELWDPGTGTWQQVVDLDKVRTEFALVPLGDGRALVIGGRNTSDQSFSSAWAFDPVTEHWSKVGLMDKARAAPAVAVLHDGRVLVAGGYLAFEPRWSRTTEPIISLATYRRDSSASDSAPLADIEPPSLGRAMATAELFDPRTGTWSSTGSMRYARAGAVAATLSDGRILVAGHDNAGQNYQWHPAPRLVRLLPSGALDTIFTIPYFTGTAIGQPDGKVLAISTNANNKTTLRRFNTDGSPDAGFVPSAFVDGADPLALQSDGKILVGKYDYRPGSVLVRLNPDGSPDNSFASALSDGKVDSILLRANGKLIITGDFSVDGTNRLAVAQLNEDGGLDATFKLDPAPYVGWSTPMLEQADGGLVTAVTDIRGYGAVMQWNSDGSLARQLTSLKGLPGLYLTGSGYRGRTGIYELMIVNDRMRVMIHDGAGEHELERAARELTSGIRDDGRAKVLAGATSLEELFRVAREE
jgi:uncharacterized delta-60 repeat protein